MLPPTAGDMTIRDELSRLATEMDQLKSQVRRLEDQLRQSTAQPAASHHPPPTMAPANIAPETTNPTEEFWLWLGQASLLPRIAAISFALVIALLLRTLTDSKVLAVGAGTFIGLAYAALLIGSGAWLQVRRHRLGPVLPVCGAILMFLVIIETHARFAAIPTGLAYALLLATMLLLCLLAVRHGVPLFSVIGIIGASLSAYTIDFPNPGFITLGIFLLLANIAAYVLASLPRHGNEINRWAIFLLTGFFWLHWVAKLSKGLTDPPDMIAPLNIAWFLPFLLLFALLYLGTTAHRTFVLGRLTALDSILPTVSTLLFYLAAKAILIPWMGIRAGIGLAGLGWTALLFLAAALAAHHSRESSKAACIFTFAGAALLLAATPDLVTNLLLALPLWSLGGLFLVRFSGHCEIGGIRLASYLLQIAAGITGFATGGFSITATNLPLSLAVATALMTMAAFHYQQSRRHPLACSSGFFATIDRHDRSAIALLLVAAANGFAMLQLGAALVLADQTTDFPNLITGLRSFFLTSGAVLLMMLGLRTRNRDLLAVALAIFIIAAGKVFGYDLFEARGVPLVLSVFSFGVAAALGSLTMRRWQQSHLPPAAE
ncbi:MAG: SlyX family protein [Desulfurivibrio sp.]|nr:SlyX family protein [Desulfurivibrio sp.]MBU4118347.1 DUF2339 domain-containing protein [Pseudomonadota bacterium]